MSFTTLNQIGVNNTAAVNTFNSYKPAARSYKPFSHYAGYSQPHGGGGYANCDIGSIIQLILSMLRGGYGGYQPAPAPQPYTPPAPPVVYDPVNPTVTYTNHKVWGDPHFVINGKNFDFGNDKPGETFSYINSATHSHASNLIKYGGATVNGQQGFAFMDSQGQAQKFIYDPATDKLTHNGEEVKEGDTINIVTAATDEKGAPIQAQVNFTKGKVNVVGPEYAYDIVDKGTYVDLERISTTGFGTELDGDDVGLLVDALDDGLKNIAGNNSNLRLTGDFNGDGQEETIDPNVLYKVADLFGAPQGARFGQGVVQGQIGVDANIQGGTAQ